MRSVFNHALLFVICLSCWTVPAVAQKLHLVIVADVNDKDIGVSTFVDQKNIFNLFYNNVPPQRLSIVVVQPDQVTREGILNAIRNLNVQPSDTVVFYYSGHGGNRIRYGQLFHLFWLSLGQEDLYFYEVQEEVMKKHPYIAVFLRDCCNSVTPLPRSSLLSVPLLEKTSPPPQKISPLFERLFFQKEIEKYFDPRTEKIITTEFEVVDIIGSEIGYLSYGNEKFGGFFTSNFWGVLTVRADRQDSWEQIFDVVRAKTGVMADGSSKRQLPVLGRYNFWESEQKILPDNIVPKMPIQDINPRNFTLGDLASRSSQRDVISEDTTSTPPADTRPQTPPTINSLQKQQIFVIPKRILRWRR